MKNLLGAVLATVLLTASLTAWAAGKGAVIQVTDENKINMALVNVINTRKVMPKVELELVVYGPAIVSLRADSASAEKIEEARKKGVRIVACEESMTGFKLSKADMLPGIEYVPFGLQEILNRQFSGWAYARP